MGAWGVGPLENDTALDLVQAWQRFRTGGFDPECYTPEGTMNYFIGGSLGQTMDWGDVETTSRLIALAELYCRDGLSIRGKIKEYFEEAINWELRKDALGEWDDPKARKRALEDLLARIGGKRRRLTTSKLFRHPAIEFKSRKELLKKLEPWLQGIRAHRLSQHPPDREYPRLWQVLDRVMNNRVRHLGDTLKDEGLTQRLMLLGAYFGIYCRLSVEETMALVRRASERGGLMFGHSTDLGQEYLIKTDTAGPPDNTRAV